MVVKLGEMAIKKYKSLPTDDKIDFKLLAFQKMWIILIDRGFS